MSDKEDPNVIDLSEFKKIREGLGNMPEPDIKKLLFRLIGVTIDLASHLEEAKEEIAKLKSRQLKIAQQVMKEE